MIRRSFLFVLATGLVWSSVRAEDKASPLEGRWVVVSVERDGKQDEALAGAVRVHTADSYTLTPKDGKTVTGKWKADATKKPATIDLIPGEGRYKDKVLLGIYELDGETLRICFAEPGKDRPTEFVARAGSVLAVHKREKK
jgi:uncharacterized protein (TIGR03067 family)